MFKVWSKSGKVVVVGGRGGGVPSHFHVKPKLWLGWVAVLSIFNDKRTLVLINVYYYPSAIPSNYPSHYLQLLQLPSCTPQVIPANPSYMYEY